MGYESTNSRKIAQAFTKSRTGIDLSLQTGLEMLLDKGVELCLAEHDAKHQRHLESGDTYAWVLFHNGVEVKRKTFMPGKEVIGYADRTISLVKSKTTGIGWEGFVVAGVKSTKDNGQVTYFDWLYELYPMRDAIRDIKDINFSDYFKQVKI